MARLKNLKEKILILKGSLLYQLFNFYVMLIVIPIIILSFFFYIGINSTIKEEITSRDMSNVKVFSNNTKRIIEEGKGTILNIVLNSYMRDMFLLSNTKRDYSFAHLYSQDKILELIKTYGGMNKEIHSIYILDEGDDIVLSSRGTWTKREDFHDRNIFNTYKNERLKSFYISETRLPIDDDLEERTLSIEQKDRINNWDMAKVNSIVLDLQEIEPRYHGCIIINIYARNFNYGEGDEQYLIYGKNKEVISGEIEYQDQLIAHVDEALQKENMKGHFQRSYGNEKYLVTYEKLGIHDLVAVKVSQLSILYKEVNVLHGMLLGISILTILFGTFFSYKRSKKIYQPLKGTLEQLDIKIKAGSYQQQNELKILSSAVSSMVKDLNRATIVNEENRHKLRYAQVLELLKGNGDALEFIFPNHNENYMSLIIAIDHYDEFKKTYSRKEQYYMKRLILNVAMEALNQEFKAEGALLENSKLGIIIASSEKEEIFYKKLDQSIKAIMLQVEALEKVSVSVAIGQLYRQGTDIKNSYMDALEALKYKMIKGHSSILYARELQFEEIGYYNLNRKDRHLLNYLETNNFVEVHELIDVLTQEIKEERQYLISHENVIQVFYRLLNQTFEYFISKNISLSSIHINEKDIYKSIVKKETIEEMSSLLHDFYHQIEKHVITNNKSEKKHLDKIIETIKKEHVNCNFNTEQLVEEVGISYPHINRILKENLGISYSRYISQLRIEHAKELLMTTELLVEDIAGLVGYNNGQSFLRNFKKIEGITPMEYRRKHQG